MNNKSLIINVLNAFIIAIILFLGFLFIVANFSVQIDWPRDLGLFDKGIYLNRFFADFFLYAGLFLLLYSKPLAPRILAYVVSVAFTLVFLVQAQSFDITGGFIPSIALENAQHADFLDTDQHIFAAIVWSIFLILVARLIAVCVSEPPSFKARIPIVLLLVIISSLVKNDKSWLSDETLSDRFDFYNSGRAGFERTSPISELKNTVREYQEYLDRENWVDEAAEQMSVEGARLALRHKLPFGELNKEYPLMREGTSHDPLSFLSPANDGLSKPHNLIVFFVEGVSTRAMQPYSDLFPNLWPNLDDFSKYSTRVDNYYSHAYATYRGLSGQLCSIYSVGRLLENTNYHCLGHELSLHGYDSRFMVSQRLIDTDLDDLAIRAGFDHVDGSEVLVPLLSLPEHQAKQTIADKYLIKGLIARMKERDANSDKPFAIGLYNFETHTGARLIEDNTRYSHEGIARAATLDNFHNYDQAFGEFWTYFKGSPYYENTVVVVTTDHATFPSREYNDLVTGSPGYVPVFADKIPLIIYHPNGRSEEPIDANEASAVNLVPSLLHVLGLRSETNAFLGQSVFMADNTYPGPAASGGAVLWSRHKSGRWKRISDRNRNELPEIFEDAGAYFDYIKFTQSLERTNKLIRSR